MVSKSRKIISIKKPKAKITKEKKTRSIQESKSTLKNRMKSSQMLKVKVPSKQIPTTKIKEMKDNVKKALKKGIAKKVSVTPLKKKTTPKKLAIVPAREDLLALKKQYLRAYLTLIKDVGSRTSPNELYYFQQNILNNINKITKDNIIIKIILNENNYIQKLLHNYKITMEAMVALLQTIIRNKPVEDPSMPLYKRILKDYNKFKTNDNT